MTSQHNMLDVAEAVSRLHASLRANEIALSSITGRGPVLEFESAFGKFVDAKRVVAMPNGTAALMTALHVAGVKPGDEVIVPALTWRGILGPILAIRATPVFADAAPKSFTVSPESVASLLSSRTKAIVAVHHYGYPANVPALSQVARCAAVPLIIDSAQGLGAEIEGRPVGAYGDLVCFSFGLGPAKLLFTAEGGALACNTQELFERAVLISQHPLRAHSQVESKSWRLALDNGCSLAFRMHPLVALLASYELAQLGRRLKQLQKLFLSASNTLAKRLPIDCFPSCGQRVQPSGAILALFPQGHQERNLIESIASVNNWRMERLCLDFLPSTLSIVNHFDCVWNRQIAAHASHSGYASPNAKRMMLDSPTLISLVNSPCIAG